MSLTRNLMLAGIAASALAGPALCQTLHEETVQIGPNMVEQIFYTGNVAPQVTMQPAPDALLAAMAQQQAAMAAQAQQMLQQAAALMNAPAMPVMTAARSGSACVTSMSFVQINGEKPQVTEYSSPGCGSAAAAPVQPAELQPARAPAAPMPKLIQARLAAPPDQPPAG